MAERKDMIIKTEEFPSNSFKTKERNNKESIKVEKIKMEGKVKRKKKSMIQKASETIFDEDAKTVGESIFHDVVIPAIKSLLADTITNGINMFLYGDGSPSGRSTIRDRNRSYVSYKSYYDDDRRERNRRNLDRAHRARHDFDEVIFETRGDAERTLSRLIDIVEEYDEVTVADFYDFVDIEPNYTDRNWGWTNLRGTAVVRVPSGYIIDFPRTEVLD